METFEVVEQIRDTFASFIKPQTVIHASGPEPRRYTLKVIWSGLEAEVDVSEVVHQTLQTGELSGQGEFRKAATDMVAALASEIVRRGSDAFNEDAPRKDRPGLLVIKSDMI